MINPTPIYNKFKYVSAPCGSGKTTAICNIINNSTEKYILVQNTQELIKQTAKQINNCEYIITDTVPKDESVINAGKDKLTAVSDTFCSTIEKNGYTCGVYANRTWLTTHLNTPELAKKYEIWLAEYLSVPSPTHSYAKTQKPKYTLTPFKYWQFASDGKINGINGNVDLDLGYDIFD